MQTKFSSRFYSSRDFQFQLTKNRFNLFKLYPSQNPTFQNPLFDLFLHTHTTTGPTAAAAVPTSPADMQITHSSRDGPPVLFIKDPLFYPLYAKKEPRVSRCLRRAGLVLLLFACCWQMLRLTRRRALPRVPPLEGVSPGPSLSACVCVFVPNKLVNGIRVYICFLSLFLVFNFFRFCHFILALLLLVLYTFAQVVCSCPCPCVEGHFPTSLPFSHPEKIPRKYGVLQDVREGQKDYNRTFSNNTHIQHPAVVESCSEFHVGGKKNRRKIEGGEMSVKT